MKEKSNQLLEELIKLTGKEDFEELREQLFKRGVESLLRAQMTAHLGYGTGQKPVADNQRNGYSKKTIKTSEGTHRINIPRDRKTEFEPIIVPKHKAISQDLEDCIILLYAKGMSNNDIIDFIKHTCGVNYSSSQVSLITNQLLADIRDWQERPLEDQYAVVWIDAIHYKIRQDGKVKSKACMISLGINMEGQQDILSMSIVENKSAAA